MSNLRFQAWCRRAVSRIVLPQDRITAGRELLDHMEDRYEHCLDQGAVPAEAEVHTIAAMGDPEELSYQLGAIHRPFWGLLLRYSQRVLTVLLCITVFFLGAHLLVNYIFFRGYSQPVYYRYDPYEDTLIDDSVGKMERISYSEPEAVITSDGYTLTLARTALWHGTYVDAAGQWQEDDYLHFQIEVFNPRPWAVHDDIIRWFWAEDNLGNYYYASYEQGTASAPGVQGSVYHTKPLTWIHDMYLTDFISQGAAWIDLHYDRAGRDLVLRIHLTGGTA